MQNLYTKHFSYDIREVIFLVHSTLHFCKSSHSFTLIQLMLSVTCNLCFSRRVLVLDYNDKLFEWHDICRHRRLVLCTCSCWTKCIYLGCIQCSQMYLVLFGSKSPSCVLYCIYCWKVATDGSLCRICIQSISVMTFEQWYFWSTVHCISASHPIVSLWYNWCCQWLVTLGAVTLRQYGSHQI